MIDSHAFQLQPKIERTAASLLVRTIMSASPSSLRVCWVVSTDVSGRTVQQVYDSRVTVERQILLFHDPHAPAPQLVARILVENACYSKRELVHLLWLIFECPSFAIQIDIHLLKTLFLWTFPEAS